jgi:hypothetical protein
LEPPQPARIVAANATPIDMRNRYMPAPKTIG